MAADRKSLRMAVSWTLWGGVSLSGILIAAGLLLGLSTGRDAPCPALLRAGLMILIATPVLPLGVLAAGFARAAQWRFFWACAFLLSLLAVSVLSAWVAPPIPIQ